MAGRPIDNISLKIMSSTTQAHKNKRTRNNYLIFLNPINHTNNRKLTNKSIDERQPF